MNSLDWVKERSGTIGLDEPFWSGRDVANFINDYNYLNDLIRFSAEVKHFEKAENFYKAIAKLWVVIIVLQIAVCFMLDVNLTYVLITGYFIIQSLYFIGLNDKNKISAENKLTKHVKNKNNIL